MKIRFLVLCTLASFVCYSSPASANLNLRQKLATYRLDSPHGYVSGNMGISQLFDQKTTGTSNNVNEYGPGWNVNGGYQINSMWGVEAGYTNYYNSRETSGSFTIAKTLHYSVDVAGTIHLPVIKNFSAIGKLGLAYAYMNKMYIETGYSLTANAVSTYWGLGADYTISPRFDVEALYANATGNGITGSSGLFSIGLTMALV